MWMLSFQTVKVKPLYSQSIGLLYLGPDLIIRAPTCHRIIIMTLRYFETLVHKHMIVLDVGGTTHYARLGEW